MRVVGENGNLLGFGNMENRPITGTTDWTKYQIVMDVSHDSANIAFGALLVGDGWIWCDTFEFETVETNTPTTVARDFVHPDRPLKILSDNSTPSPQSYRLCAALDIKLAITLGSAGYFQLRLPFVHMSDLVGQQKVECRPPPQTGVWRPNVKI
jgi:hypothetical protein